MIGNRMLAKSFRISGCYWRAKRHQLEKIINNEAGLDNFQSSHSCMLFVFAVEACAISPGNPWLPQARYKSAYHARWPDILQQPNYTAWFHDAAKRAERQFLLLIRQHAEQKTCDRCIKRRVWKSQRRHVHQMEVSCLRDGRTPAARPGQHSRTRVDPRYVGADGVIGTVPAGAYAGIQQPTAEIVE